MSSAASIFDFDATTIDGRRLPLSDYRGSVLLVVNVASRCGFTPQYAGLERLYRLYRDRGLVVLGGQEPGTDADIETFCKEAYDVSFPLFQKTTVNGSAAHPLYRYLRSQKRGWLGTDRIKWNFTKFLIDRSGRVVARFGTTATPAAIEQTIVNLLDSDDAGV
jgi:glutathione peroxidase